MEDKEAKAIKRIVGEGPTDTRLVLTIDNLVKLGFGSRNTLYRLARLNQLPVPTIEVGHRLYVSKLAVDRLLEGAGSHEG
ncbi:hypothetical protein ES708_17738 [subsurface metagenome]